jgi:hypothetical protein
MGLAVDLMQPGAMNTLGTAGRVAGQAIKGIPAAWSKLPSLPYWAKTTPMKMAADVGLGLAKSYFAKKPVNPPTSKIKK